MNVQAHMSGPAAAAAQNQAAASATSQNGSTLVQQMQNLGAGEGGGGGVRGFFAADNEMPRARILMQEKIYTILSQRHQQQPLDENTRKKFKEIVKRLEEGLLRSAHSKEDYMNLDTLESRLHQLIKRSHMNPRTQYPQLVNSSSPVGTMIPTPGMSHSGNSTMIVASSVDASMIAASAPTTVNPGSLLPSGGIHGGSFNRSDGSLSNGYQQSPANFSLSSGGNLSSMGAQTITSQMIPTPGFNSNNNNSNINNSQSYMNMESSNNGGGFSNVESTMVSQPLQQKQHHGGQNSRILHSLGSQMGSGIRSGLQQKAYGFANGALNGGGLGLMGNNLQLVNERGTSEGYLSATSYSNSPKPFQPHFDQHQQPIMQGDGYGMSNSDSFGSGNFYGAATSVGSMMNTQNLSSVSLPSISKTNSSLISNQSNLKATQQAAYIKTPSVDQSEKMNFQASMTSRDNLLHSHQQQPHQFQQQPHQFQQQQFVQQQRQQKQLQQHQNMLNNDTFGQSQLTSDIGNQVKREPGVEHHDEVMNSQVSEQFQLSEMQNQFQHLKVQTHQSDDFQVSTTPSDYNLIIGDDSYN